MAGMNVSSGWAVSQKMTDTFGKKTVTLPTVIFASVTDSQSFWKRILSAIVHTQ
jgi:hypothetical protein